MDALVVLSVGLFGRDRDVHGGTTVPLLIHPKVSGTERGGAQVAAPDSAPRHVAVQPRQRGQSGVTPPSARAMSVQPALQATPFQRKEA
jgi:hypothetical protein